MLGAAALGSLVALLGAFSACGLVTPAAREGTSRIFTVRSGEPLHSALERLKDEGLLAERPLFGPRVLAAWARLSGTDRAIKSGEYELSPTQTPLEILAKLRSGMIRTLAVTVPEGLRMDEVAERLERAGITDSRAFLRLATDAELARSLGIEAETLEGYLYPETYRFRRDAPPEEVLRAMVEEFRERLAEEDRERLEKSGLSLHELVTLASLVEKETAVPEERPLVSAVFLNRLRKGMRLQSDPTVIYGIVRSRGSFDGNLRRRDLETDTPYNTYTRAGLPKGPIASPTIDAIRACLDPADVAYLYFVSRNDGTHVFSETFAEHVRAVDRYQRARPAGS